MVAGGTGSKRGRSGPARVLGIGEILWDLLPDGPRLGGAPFNAIAHLARLGYDATYVTAVGPDALGREALAAAKRLGVDTRYMSTVSSPTGTARVEIDGEGTPRFDIASPAAYESPRLTDADVDEIVGLSPRAIVFGTLAQRSAIVHGLTTRLAAMLPTADRVYDVNLRQGCWSVQLVDELMRTATIAKLNADEMVVLAPGFDAPSTSAPEFCESVARRFGLRAVSVTRGARGAGLWIDGAYYEEPAVPVQVVDTVGAGDAFTAALVDGLIRGEEPRAVLRRANALAAFVASRPGAIPEE